MWDIDDPTNTESSKLESRGKNIGLVFLYSFFPLQIGGSQNQVVWSHSWSLKFLKKIHIFQSWFFHHKIWITRHRFILRPFSQYFSQCWIMIFRKSEFPHVQRDLWPMSAGGRSLLRGRAVLSAEGGRVVVCAEPRAPAGVPGEGYLEG